MNEETGTYSIFTVISKMCQKVGTNFRLKINRVLEGLGSTSNQNKWDVSMGLGLTPESKEKWVNKGDGWNLFQII